MDRVEDRVDSDEVYRVDSDEVDIVDSDEVDREEDKQSRFR